MRASWARRGLRASAHAIEEQFHEHLVVLVAVEDDLPREAAALGEPKRPVERLRRRIGGSHEYHERTVARGVREAPGRARRALVELMEELASQRTGRPRTRSLVTSDAYYDSLD